MLINERRYLSKQEVKYCNVSATAGGSICKMTLSGDIIYFNKQRMLQSKLTVSQMTLFTN